ncbi:glycosyltransferase family 2 protein [Phenylobacterium sp.]|uniref:glycosyltransferase family 2 protein n=1 Tax=Phenylobacterium sp. TaxID=1871053 RepID=UPI0025D031B6|nr:glycosyltransferase family 2 protein [Phenylobacterium sp.]
MSVVIVTFRNADDPLRCLEALARSTHRDFDVCLVENGGQEAHAALAQRLPATLPGGQSVRLVLAPGNLGFAAGVNLGMASTPDAEAWWILNPDTQPEPEALAAMVDRLDRGDCGAVGCTLFREDGRIQSYGGAWRRWLARPISLGKGRDADAAIDAQWVERSQNYLNGASILVSRTFLDAVGPMKEDYFLYCEESEWFLRESARRIGIGFAPGARVQHAQGTTTGAGAAIRAQPRMPIYLNERNKILLTKDRYPLLLPIAALAVLAHLFARYVRQRAWLQFGYGLEGWLAGLVGERGPPSRLRRSARSARCDPRNLERDPQE